MREASRRVAPPALAALGALALVWLALIGTLALRSGETWIPADPALAQRLLDLAVEQRRLNHAWEDAQRGEARFALDSEIRVTAARIEEIESRARRPLRVLGPAPWSRLAPVATALARAAAETLAATLASLALAAAIVGPLARLRPRTRLLALASLLAPLGLPPPLLAGAVADLGRSIGLPPSPGLAFVAMILAGLPLALAVLALAAARLPRGEIAAARDLGLTPAAIRRHLVLPALAPALAAAAGIVVLRLAADLSIGRIAGAATTTAGFGAWLRHRVVAAVDYPNAAAGSLAALVVALIVAVALAVAVRRLAPPMPRCAPPHRSRAPVDLAPPDAGALGAVLVAIAAVVSSAPVLVLARDALAGGLPGEPFDPRLVAALADLARAGLAGALALAAGLGLAVAVDRSLGCRPGRIAPLALVAAALPPPTLGLGLRLLVEDGALPMGPAIAVLAQALTALGPVAVLLLVHLPPHRPGEIRPPIRLGLGPVLPLAAATGFALALAVADVGSILGLVDRDALLRPPTPPGTADPAAWIALAAALATGLLGARILETARRNGLDP